VSPPEKNVRADSYPTASAARLYLLYHEIRASEAAYSYVTGAEMFGRHLDLYALLRGSGIGLTPEITFDDGHISNIAIAAPMLAAHDLAASFFITVGWTGRKSGYMGWDDLRSLHRAGHTIGAHGWSHTLLTHCKARELDKELGQARLTLEDKLGAAVTTMSLPGGRYNAGVLRACTNAGYSHIFTSVPQAAPLPLQTTVGRLNIRGDMQPEWIAELFAADGKLLHNLMRQSQRKEAVKKLLGDRLYFKFWAMLNRQEEEPAQNEDAAE
jgi:peptidoglycan/xylan/chitin deacetylase (PgdA/CDA1 family)